MVITDDLERPTGQSSPGAAAVRADQAGADIILVSTTEGAGSAAYGAMLAAARSGAIPGSTIAEPDQRILALKQQYAGS